MNEEGRNYLNPLEKESRESLGRSPGIMTGGMIVALSKVWGQVDALGAKELVARLMMQKLIGEEPLVQLIKELVINKIYYLLFSYFFEFRQADCFQEWTYATMVGIL